MPSRHGASKGSVYCTITKVARGIWNETSSYVSGLQVRRRRYWIDGHCPILIETQDAPSIVVGRG